jgi:transposase-like protein
MPEYSENFKRKMVQRMTGPHPISATALSREVGVSQATLSRWLLAAGTIGPMSKKTTLHERTPARAEERKPEDKLRMVVEAARLSDEELGAFLRREGLHDSDLAAWGESMLGALKPATNKHVRSVEARRVRELESELRRKEKALAEAAALLVLQKKSGTSGGPRTTTRRRRTTSDHGAHRRSRRGRRAAREGLRGARAERPHHRVEAISRKRGETIADPEVA